MAGTIDLATYSARLILDDASFTSGMRNAERQGEGSIKNLTTNFASLGGALLKVGGIFGVGLSFKSFVDDASEAEEGMTQLKTVLESTKGAVGLTADEISSMAGELQKVTKFSDDEILSGQNLLLTFTNIGKDVFPQVTETMLDMSQALGQDMKSSSVQLGKALNDPINGVTALSRVGVSFTDQQKEQIKALVESGKTMEAQKIILKELNTEFGGSAKSAGSTFAGQLARLKNQFGEVSESIGGSLLPYLTKFSTYAIDNMPQIRASIDNAIGTATKIFDGLKTSIKFVIDNSNILIPVVGGVVTAITALNVINTVKGLMDAWKASTLVQTIAQGGLNAVLTANPIGVVIVAIGALVAAGIALYMNWDKVTAFIKGAWEGMKTACSSVFTSISQFITDAWNGIKSGTESVWNGIKSFISTLWDGIVWIFQNMTLVGIIISHWDEIKNKTVEIWNGIKTFFTGLWDGIIEYMKKIPENFTNIGKDMFNGLLDGIKSVWTTITSFVENSVNWLKDKLTFWKSGQKEMSSGGSSGATINVPSYDVGTPFVPNDQLAFIHKGEAIVPRQYNIFNPQNQSQQNSQNESFTTSTPSNTTKTSTQTVTIQKIEVNNPADFNSFMQQVNNRLKQTIPITNMG